MKLKIKGRINLPVITWAFFSAILYYMYSGPIMATWSSLGASKILATILTFLTFIGPGGIVNLVFWSGLVVLITFSVAVIHVLIDTTRD